MKVYSSVDKRCLGTDNILKNRRIANVKNAITACTLSTKAVLLGKQNAILVMLSSNGWHTYFKPLRSWDINVCSQPIRPLVSCF